MEIFNKEDFNQIREYAGKKYSPSLPVFHVFKNQIEKLKFFIKYIDDNLKIDLEINRIEKINKQAGRGAKHNNFAEYLLVGFCPKGFNMSRTFFIKAAIHNLKNTPSLVLELDVDFASTKKSATKEMATEVHSIQKRHRIEYLLSEVEKLNWDGLINRSKQNLNNLIDDYMEIYEKFIGDMNYFGILANMGWNSHNWSGLPTSEDLEISKNFGFVSENNEMHESFNFGYKNLPIEEDGSYIAYSPSFNVNVSHKDEIRVIFITSTNPDRKRMIVGCYAFPEIGEFPRKAKHPYFEKYNSGNLKSKVNDIIYFDNYLPANQEEFLPPGKSLSKQRFNYLEKSNVEKIFESAIAANPGNNKLKDIASRVLNQNNMKPNLSENQKSLSIILYGPPGTGKTYNTVELAYEIIHGYKAANHEEAQAYFKQERGNRIEFITFHQNYAYEDFVQGIRPKLFDEQLKFGLKDGIFSKICFNAMFEFYIKQAVKKDKPDEELEFEELYNFFLDYLKEQDLKSIEFKSIEKKPIHIKSINEKGNIQITHGNKIKPYLVSKNRLQKLWNSFDGDISKINNVNDDIRNTIKGCNTTAYWTIFNELLKFKNDYASQDDDTDELEDFSELDFKQKKELIKSVGFNSLSNIAKDTVADKYVLIIDEINRANISRVFGELITLIEKDKRLGGDNEIRVSLPNDEEFAIPPNIYIIGTMNTADKSIALVDIALRRRFEFRKMYPLYQIDGHKIFYSENLKSMNKKIRELKGADFQIGHSYFMGGDFDLEYTMNNKVIPLLYEYFMNDSDSVKDVLKAGSFDFLSEDKTVSGLIEFTETTKGEDESNIAEPKE